MAATSSTDAAAPSAVVVAWSSTFVRVGFLSRLKAYLSNLCNNFGAPFLILLGSNYFLLKGASQVLIHGAQLPYFKMLNIDGSRYQTLGVIVATPWAMKGVIGGKLKCCV